jgi:hypothetical protein
VNAILATKRRHGRRLPPAAGGPDLGPTVRDEAGRERPLRHDVEVVDAPDPDAPSRTIRRARVLPVYARMHRDGRITDEQREAADRYLTAWQVAEHGARDGGAESVGRIPGWAQDRMTLAVVNCAKDLREARATLRPWERQILDAVVLADQTLAAASISLGIRPDASEVIRAAAAAERLSGALSQLATHWGIDSA